MGRRISLLELVRLQGFLAERFPGAAAVCDPSRWHGRSMAELADELVDERVIFDVLSAAMRGLRRPELPLDFAQTTRLEHLGALGFAVQTAPTVREALDRLERFQALASTSGVSEVVLDGALVRIVWRRHTQSLDLGVRVANEVVIAQQVVLARQLGLRSPHRVSFRHAAPSARPPHPSVFGCPVTWAAADDAVHWPREVLDRRLPLADPGLNRFLDEEALRRLNARPREDDALEAVRRCISRRLASRGVALDDVAQDLGLSPGEVRRRLRAGGTTFRALVDEVRRARAEALLVAGGLSLSEVALLLGFSELSAFSRAHRRWFSSSARARRVKS